LPLLGGCSAAYLVAWWLSPTSIMTEKIVRRGGRVPDEYGMDHLAVEIVRDWAARTVVTLDADATVASVRERLAGGAPGTSHQGFPVLDRGRLIGVATRRELLGGPSADARRVRDVLSRPPIVVFEDSSLRDAADQMVREGIGRLPVVTRADPRHVVGIVTRSDLLAAHRPRLAERHDVERGLARGLVRRQGVTWKNASASKT
jgi:CIC family chloride channel protein